MLQPVNELRGGSITLDIIREPHPKESRRTKIICTLGPACWSEEGLLDLIDGGMNVARFNFSHGTHESHGEVLARLREVNLQRPNNHVAIMLDTKGPEIRTGFFDEENKPTIALEKGQLLELTTDYSFLGNPNKIACSYEDLPNSVEVGGMILVADGSLVLTVKEILENGVVCEVNNNAVIGERKNMNLPGCHVTLPTLTEKDEDDIVNFGIVHGIDIIAASFVRSAEDVRNIRQLLEDNGAPTIKIIAKIENQQGLENFDEILQEADGIMVARGDLGMEIPPEKVFLAQKWMIRKCNIAGKPVITATQMLESMITHPRPTRAECADVANAVLDGTDCVMLSGETANGEYADQAVRIMARVCCESEVVINYSALFQAIRQSVLLETGVVDTAESIASSAVKTSWDVDAKMIIVLTETGNTARLIAKYRPLVPIVVITATPEVARQCEGLLRNTHAFMAMSMVGTNPLISRGIRMGMEEGWVHANDNVVCVHGTLEAHSGSTNMMRVIHIDP
jgi:pyruvate kinase